MAQCNLVKLKNSTENWESRKLGASQEFAQAVSLKDDTALDAALSVNNSKLKLELLSLIAKAIRIVEDQDDPMMSTRSWDDVYDDIFSIHMSERIHKLLNDLSISFDYCDPDTTYEEDVRAYVDALARLAEDILKD